MAIAPCYFFSPASFLYAGQSTYDTAGPLPTNSTATAPPAPAARTAYAWNVGEATWNSVVDYRGVQTYEKATGNPGIFITATGVSIPSGYTDIAPPDAPTQPTAYDWSDVSTSWISDPTKQKTALAAAVRLQRNSLLAQSDFIEGQDVPCTSGNLQLWSQYRQWLRDLPTQSGFPGTVSWPVKPSYVKAASLDPIATKQTAVAAGYTFAVANPM